MTGLNDVRPIRRLGVTRRRLREEVDRPALGPLPRSPTSTQNGRSAASASTSCRCRLPLLQRPASFPARRGRGAADGADRRGLLRGRTDRRSSARRRQSQHTTFSGTCRPPPPLPGWTIERIRARRSGSDRRRRRCASGSWNLATIPEQGYRACLGIVRLSGRSRRPSASRLRPSAPSDRRQDLRFRQIHPRQPS